MKSYSTTLNALKSTVFSHSGVGFPIALNRYSIFKMPLRNKVTLTQTKLYSLKDDPTASATEMTFAAQPLQSESKCDFRERAKNEVSGFLFNKKFANHELIMSCPTWVARHGEKMKTYLGKPMLTGHCLLAYMNDNGQVDHDYTISLRPDMTKQPLYKARTAPDSRLPEVMQTGLTIVRPATHTTAADEIKNWAEDVFYMRSVYAKHPDYSLRCLLRPLHKGRRSRFFSAVNDVKLSFQRYSLLDHLHPHTGVTMGDIVAAENCTVISELIERVLSVDLKKTLGDNPTPQVVVDSIKNLYFKEETVAKTEGEDGLNKPYVRPYS